MALVTTIGGASADSYATVTEYQEYWSAHLFPPDQDSPDSFGPDDVENAMREACLVLEGESYYGRIVYQTQALKWPRAGIYDDEQRAVSSTTIPQAIKNAQCEIAYQLLIDPQAYEGDAFAGYSNIGLGNGEVSVNLRAGGGRSALPAKVITMLRQLRSGRQARVLRA